MGIGHFAVYSGIHLTRMGSRPSRSYTAIQRYTVYSYTSLYTIHPLQHPSGGSSLVERLVWRGWGLGRGRKGWGSRALSEAACFASQAKVGRHPWSVPEMQVGGGNQHSSPRSLPAACVLRFPPRFQGFPIFSLPCKKAVSLRSLERRCAGRAAMAEARRPYSNPWGRTTQPRAVGAGR